MQFNNPSSPATSLYHDTLSLCGILSTDTTTLPVVDFTRSANEALKETNQLIWQSTGEWEFDDSNYATLPSAKRDMTASVNNYLIPSYAQKIDRLQVLDNAGDWHKVTPFDKGMTKEALEELYTTTGLPEYYDIVGESLVLYPTPDATTCTLTQGLELFFSREMDEFLITDTTKEPGFNSDFHRMISLKAALDWAMPKGLSIISSLQNQISNMKDNIAKFYGSRDRDLKVKIVPPLRSFK